MPADPTAAKIDRKLREWGSPWRGLGATFVKQGRAAGVDPLFLVAISGIESSFGRYNYRPHNAWGWGGMSFGSWDEAIGTVARGIRKGYLDEGLTSVDAIGRKYAPVGADNDPKGTNGEWIPAVTKFYRELGGKQIKYGSAPASTDTGPTTPSLAAPPTSPPGVPPLPSPPPLSADMIASLGGGLIGGPYSTGLSGLVRSVYQAATAPAALPTAPKTPKVVDILPGDVPVVAEVRKPGKGALAAVALAKEYLGTPYSWGGGNTTGPSEGFDQGKGIVGFDCSSLLQFVWAKQGVSIPRVTYDQWKTGTSVAKTKLQPGDAVFFRPGPQGPEHVGMYVGNDQFIQAPRTGDVVKISKFSTYGGYMGARRYR